MRCYVTLEGAGEATAIDVKPRGTGTLELRTETETVEADVAFLSEDAFSLLCDGQSYDIQVVKTARGLTVTVDGEPVPLVVEDERARQLRSAAKASLVEGRCVVSAPMPGKVVKLWVKAGDAVTAGQGLVVVEAMKMENELKSPKAGVVVEVSCQEGSPVEANAKLLVVD